MSSNTTTPKKLIPVLRKSSRTRTSYHATDEDELNVAIAQLRMRDGDEGYKYKGLFTAGSGSNSKTNSIEKDCGGFVMRNCESWRKDGRERRSKMLAEDDLNGGSDFHINQQCSLRNYCAIADRVRDQFQQAYKSNEKLQETYIMGNRLIKFLSHVLPTHRHYLSKRPECTRLRVKIQHDLMKVREQVEDVALLLDKVFYREIMKDQGMEFDISPQKKKERVRKVTFNLNSEKIEFQPDEFEESIDDDLTDLTVWEDRDPEDEDFIDLSFSSDSSSFEGSFLDMGDDKGNDNSIGAFDLFGKDDAVLDVFDGADDGWEHFSSNAGTSGGMEWPEMPGLDVAKDKPFMAIENGKKVDHVDTTEETEGTEDSADSLYQSSFTFDHEGGEIVDDHDGPFRKKDSSPRGVDEDFGGYYGSYNYNDASAVDVEVSFVEKIAHENNSRTINELHEDEDDSAQDSWAQAEDADAASFVEEIANKNYSRTMKEFHQDEDGSAQDSWAQGEGLVKDTDAVRSLSQEEPSESIVTIARDVAHSSWAQQKSNSDGNDYAVDELLAHSDTNSAIDPFPDTPQDSKWIRNENRANKVDGISGALKAESEDPPANYLEDPDEHESTTNDNDCSSNQYSARNIGTGPTDPSITPAMDADRLESSIDGHAERRASDNGFSEAGDTALPSFHEGAQSESELPLQSSHSSLEYSYSSTSAHNSSDMVEWDSNDLYVSDPDSHLTFMQEEFDNSQIIAESPEEIRFGGNNGENDEAEHDEFIRKMTELEFSEQSGDSSRCDSSGGGKTITTASTEETLAMTADDHSSESISSTCSQEDMDGLDPENVLGIVRREAYIPSIDSPRSSGNQWDEELDYLESKVKDLQEKKEFQLSSAVSKYPTQMAREPTMDAKDNLIASDDNPLDELVSPLALDLTNEFSDREDQGTAKSSIAKFDLAKDEDITQRAPINRGRRHMTAARLKALKQSNAWRRRYGNKCGKD